MNRTLLSTAVLFALTGSAQAQAVTGGQIGLSYNRNLTRDASQASLGGSLDFGIANRLSLQADLAGHSNGAAADIFATGGHLVYALGPNAAVGGFLTYENWSGNFHDYNYGIEGRFTTQGAMALTVEGYLLHVARDKGQSDFGGLGLEAALGVSDASSIKAGFFSAGGTADLTRISFGMNYDITPNLALGLNAERINVPGRHGNVVGLSLGYRFETGASFGRRSFADFAPGY